MSLEWGTQTLQKVRACVDVIVHSHDDLPISGGHSDVVGDLDAHAVLQPYDVDLGVAFTQPLGGSLIAAVVADDHPMRDRLASQMLQAALREIPATVGNNGYLNAA